MGHIQAPRPVQTAVSVRVMQNNAAMRGSLLASWKSDVLQQHLHSPVVGMDCRCSRYSSAIFLLHCVEKFPIPIECVQTDNGFEFTNRLNSHPTAKLTLFEKTCQQLGIRHKLIKPCTPRHNGKVERSHRKDNEEFYASHTFFSFQDYKKQLAVRQRQYNNFPMRPLHWHSPKDTLLSFSHSVTHH